MAAKAAARGSGMPNRPNAQGNGEKGHEASGDSSKE